MGKAWLTAARSKWTSFQTKGKIYSTIPMEVKDFSVHQFVLMECSVGRLTIYHSAGTFRKNLENLIMFTQVRCKQISSKSGVAGEILRTHRDPNFFYTVFIKPPAFLTGATRRTIRCSHVEILKHKPTLNIGIHTETIYDAKYPNSLIFSLKRGLSSSSSRWKVHFLMSKRGDIIQGSVDARKETFCLNPGIWTSY